MATTTVRDEARKLVDQLPDDATWDDLLYQVYVRRRSMPGWTMFATAEPCRVAR